MKFPVYVTKLTKEENDIFLNNFANDSGEFEFEGVWFRNQREANKRQSGWQNSQDERRRYIQFYDTYTVSQSGGESFLSIAKSYVYVSSTYPKQETEEYYNKIVAALEQEGFTKLDKDYYQKQDMFVKLLKYDNHPKNVEFNLTFPANYTSVDVVITSPNYEYSDIYNRMWKLSTKMFRVPGTRGEPTYINSIKDILPYLPAQIEMGCGPSIEVGIPPLYEMHETYKVQNHDTGKFYFGKEDDLVLKIIKDPESMYKQFSYVPTVCLQAKTTPAYDIFGEMFKRGYFKGTVLNNNFDRLVKRYGLDEIILRIYDKNTYLPKVNFSKDVKSLICIGTHADRRQVQKQAREQGLQIIYIDPEGFYNQNGFEPYPIEAPQTGDLILKTTFEAAMEDFKNLLFINKK